MSKKVVYGKSSEASYTRNTRIKSAIIVIVLLLLTVICLLPLYILIINSTRNVTQITTEGVSLIPGSSLIRNIKELLNNDLYAMVYDPLIGLRNSLFLAGSSTFLIVFFSAMTAYGLVVYDFKAKGIAFTFILAVMMVPVQVTSTGFLQFMIQLDLEDTYWPLIIPGIASPAIVFFMRQSLKSTFPLEIVEAARIDGCGEFKTFLKIAIPMMKPAIAVQAIFAFISKWNDYYTTSMILISGKLKQKTLPMMVSAVMSNDKTADYGVNYTAIMLSIIPVCAVYLALSKFIIAGVALGGVKE